VLSFAIQGLTWKRIEWLRSLTNLPLVIKEILTAEDARRCVDHGASGIVVSNHGGRSFDTEQATIEALPAIVEEVGDEVEVYLDSGVRRGVDVVKALALGARAVGVGRPLFWGLAIDGESGVRTMFEILRDEFSRAMAICGCLSVDDIDKSLVALPSRH
jgi:isopentenyl diphosphate isomerase/L-lactate dehydrogenase-like FMN-dependent dehydrogenase